MSAAWRCERFTVAQTVPLHALQAAGRRATVAAGMASRNETLARRIVRDVGAYTGGQAGRWAMLHAIARRLVLRDQVEVDRAVALAKENGWVELEGLHRVRLTDAGRALFGSNDKR
jgi:hypothetical protein